MAEVAATVSRDDDLFATDAAWELS